MQQGQATLQPRLITPILALAVFLFYLVTLAPSLNWADGARMQLDVSFGGSTYWSFDEARLAPSDGWPFEHLGVAAWDHPLYVILGQFFLALPVGDPLYRINLISAVFGALGIALMYQIGLLLTRDPFPALLGALALAVSHTYWFHSVTAEAYSLNMVFMALAVWIALRYPEGYNWRELAWLALAAGLGLANHIMLALTLLMVGLYIITAHWVGPGPCLSIRALASPRTYRNFLQRLGLRHGLLLLLLFGVGFAPWWIQAIRTARIIGLPLTLQMAAGFPWLAERFGVASWPMLVENLLTFVGWLVYQFSPLGVAIGVYGLWRELHAHPGRARFILGLIAIHVLFSANYRLADQFNFHLPSYFAFSLAIVCGWARLWQSIQARLVPVGARRSFNLKSVFLAGFLALVLLPVGFYALVPSGLRAMGLTEERLGVPPIGQGARDAFSYFLDPNSRNDDSAARFARSTLANLAANALVFTPKASDQETYVVLRYVQLFEHTRPDVHLELELFDPEDDLARAVLVQARQQRACRPLYLASLNPAIYPLQALEDNFFIVPEANLYRLLPRNGSGSQTTCPELASRWAGASLEQLIRLAMRRE